MNFNNYNNNFRVYHLTILHWDKVIIIKMIKRNKISKLTYKLTKIIKLNKQWVKVLLLGYRWMMTNQ
jgi:hypothetical protein